MLTIGEIEPSEEEFYYCSIPISADIVEMSLLLSCLNITSQIPEIRKQVMYS